MENSRVVAAFVVTSDRSEMAVFLPASAGLAAARNAEANLSQMIGLPTSLKYNDIGKHYIIVARDVEDERSIPSKTSAPNANERVVDITDQVLGRIPRPPNSWILYRQHHSREILRTQPGTPAGTISGIVSQMWRNETPETKNEWQERANEEARKHRMRYPDYKYKATRRREAKSQARKRAAAESEPKPAVSAMALQEYLANVDRTALSMAL